MTDTRKILILGVTASGKARLAYDLARHFHAEMVSVDSMKIYRRMDIGTAKPSPQVQRDIPIHMIDLIEPSDSYNVASYYKEALKVIAGIQARHRPVVAVGGTALYIKALIHGLFEGPGTDPDIRRRLHERADTEGLAPLHRDLAGVDPTAAERINPNDKRRIIRALEIYYATGKPISSLQTQFETPLHDWIVLGLRREKESESHRINMRVKRMIEAGLVAEVEALLQEDPPMSPQARAAIGYAEIIDYLTGNADLEKAIERIKINTRRLAKGQRTWFKSFPFVKWLSLSEESSDSVCEQALELLVNH